MSQPYVTGPAEIFVGTGTSGAYQFLGWSQDGVEMQLVASYQDVICDVSGPAVPIDSQFMGEQFYGTATLNRYNEAVLQVVAKRRVGAAVTAGAIEAAGQGSLMVAQGYAYNLLIYCPYNTLSFQTATIVPGWVFGAAWLHDQFTFNVNISVKAPRVIFRAIPIWNTVALSAVLYTNTMPSPVPSTN